jgi:hypothetical protein
MRPAFGWKPQRSAKAAAAAPIVDLTVGQFSALTSHTGVASGVGEANASKGSGLHRTDNVGVGLA